MISNSFSECMSVSTSTTCVSSQASCASVASHTLDCHRIFRIPSQVGTSGQKEWPSSPVQSWSACAGISDKCRATRGSLNRNFRVSCFHAREENPGRCRAGRSLVSFSLLQLASRGHRGIQIGNLRVSSNWFHHWTLHAIILQGNCIERNSGVAIEAFGFCLVAGTVPVDELWRGSAWTRRLLRINHRTRIMFWFGVTSRVCLKVRSPCLPGSPETSFASLEPLRSFEIVNLKGVDCILHLHAISYSAFP